MARSNGRHSEKPRAKSFAGVPRIVMDSPDFHNLSGNAVKLLLGLAYQYRGHNNGDLTAAWEVMRKHGWRSRTTLGNALKDLIEAGMVIRTREGVFTNPGGRCALYSLTWLPIDECPGKDLNISPTTTPARRFSSASIIKIPGPETGQGSAQKLDRVAGKNA